MPPSQSANRSRAVRQTLVQMTISGERIAAPPEENVAARVEQEEELPRCEAGTSGSAAAASAVPTLAAIHRERSKKRQLPEEPRGPSKLGRFTKETKVTVIKRLSEFDDQGLTMSAGKLFCQACHEVQPNLKESIKRHLLTAKHIKNLENFKAKQEANQKVQDTLMQHFSETTGVRAL